MVIKNILLQSAITMDASGAGIAWIDGALPEEAEAIVRWCKAGRRHIRLDGASFKVWDKLHTTLIKLYFQSFPLFIFVIIRLFHWRIVSVCGKFFLFSLTRNFSQSINFFFIISNGSYSINRLLNGPLILGGLRWGCLFKEKWLAVRRFCNRQQ